MATLVGRTWTLDPRADGKLYSEDENVGERQGVIVDYMSRDDLMLWHTQSDADTVYIWGCPTYGLPPNENLDAGQSYNPAYGDGTNIRVITSDTIGAEVITPRRSDHTHMVRFMTRNAANWIDDTRGNGGDWDGTVSERRRSELWHHTDFSDIYVNLMQQTFWMGVSYYFPLNWDAKNDGWGPTLLQYKRDNDPSPAYNNMALRYDEDGWEFQHRWNPTLNDDTYQDWKQFFYNASTTVPDLLAHMPSGTAPFARDARGQWNDWVFQVRPDYRTVAQGGTGFINGWLRGGSGAWEKVIEITPGNYAGSFDYGIWENTDRGWGPIIGQYMDKDAVALASDNLTHYVDNLIICDDTAGFSDVSPDRSEP